MLYRKHLAMFGPREVLLTSEEPVVAQFLNGRRQGPIGMSEEKDTAQAAREMAEVGELEGLPPLKPQLQPSAGVGERRAVARRRERVLDMLHTLPPAAQQAIRDSYAEDPLPADPPTGPIAAAQPLPQPLPPKRSAGPLVREEPTEVIGGYDPGYDDPSSRDSDRA
jgi:phospholipid/cholesterol/gamma-HCH transport system ATP-binding protein